MSTRPPDPTAPYAGRGVLVVGGGVSGVPAARALLRAGATVTVTDRRYAGGAPDAAARDLLAAGARITGDLARLPAGTTLVLTRPGARPDDPLLAAAADDGIEVICEVELAWRLRPAPAAPWLALTGTNGKTTAVGMLESILRAAGHRAVACGNIGYPTVEAVLAEPAYDVLAVELSSFQLHWSQTVAPRAAAMLNLAPDHLEWYDGSMADYVADKRRIYRPGAMNVYNADDPAVTGLAMGLPAAVGFTLGEPAPGMLGLIGNSLVDRVFPAREGDAAIGGSTDAPVLLATAADVRPAGVHNVANALAAAALARAYGVDAAAVRAGLRAYQPGAHRNAYVASVSGVDYVDDSKATNPHAAAASLAAYPRVVWIAGGQLKGVDVGPLVAEHAGRLAAAVLMGVDRAIVAEAIARHAPDLPLVDVPTSDDGAMSTAVREAARLARAGDTVLLAPAAASLDMFPGYAARGEAFVAAVAELARQAETARSRRTDEAGTAR